MNKEEWRPISGYEGLYEISNLGRIKSFVGWDGRRHVKRVTILKNTTQRINDKYSRSVVRLTKDGKGKNYKVHRLVAEAFIPNPNNLPVVNHIDGNPLNNNVNNLEWCTQKDNIKCSIEMGNTVHRINTIDRETLIEMLNNGFNYDEISAMLGVAKGTVFNYIKKFKRRKLYV